MMNNEKIFICPVCGRIYINNSNEFSIEERMNYDFQCDKCIEDEYLESYNMFINNKEGE